MERAAIPALLAPDATRPPAAPGVPPSNCGNTLVCPITGMKLESPPHRGTKCWCRCAAMPAPAITPWFMPMLKPCGEDTRRATAIARWVNSASSTVSAGGQLRVVGDVPERHHHQVPGVVRIQVQHRVHPAPRAR